MIRDQHVPENHEQFRELAALTASGELPPSEWALLKAHLVGCEECRELALQYIVLTTEGIPSLAENYTPRVDLVSAHEANGWKKLHERVREDLKEVYAEADIPEPAGVSNLKLGRRLARNPLVQMALAACLMVAVGAAAYRLGVSGQAHDLPALVAAQQAPPPPVQTGNVAEEQAKASEAAAVGAKRIAELEQQNSSMAQEIERLRARLRDVDQQLDLAKETNNQSDGQLHALAQQRDALSSQLQDANRTFESDRAELAKLRTEREKTAQLVASLETRIEELTATNREDARKLDETEQYLASDRDIRELMGARRLYIADVFDVDGGSRTRKAFGRVFYTQGKSLIFYAFDLDRQPGVVNASTFQVWGQKEMPQGQQALPMNLGILYMDNETNRRWVMRFDDPKKLAEIDAVFVTVEPSGGSQKPTTKPFLYALLRKEVNHP
jgi:TolA-binding protein